MILFQTSVVTAFLVLMKMIGVRINQLVDGATQIRNGGGIGKIHYVNLDKVSYQGNVLHNVIDDFGFTPIGAPGSGTTATPTTPAVPTPEITTQPLS